ncbi:hypothetical protein [Microbacterium excoecariae]|uniref:hypothetical protein n=1 Tax=Microbacterium excoecariae TaxID=2715210 RepID=UPI00140749ED|nr:hypothetical protein [Microbacterium excoecariae]NHI16468.1 hypothetical protein [Microbacterium excoecariae]
MGEAWVGPVRVAWGPADGARADAERVGQLARWEATPPARRAAFAAGRALLARAIDAVAPGADPRLTSRCARCGGDHGAPRAAHAAAALSVSYARGLVVAAAAPARVGALGVDAERLADFPDPSALAALFAPAAPPDARGWTRIEAVLKADGRGLRAGPERVRLTGPATASPLPRAVRARVPGAPEAAHVTDIDAIPGYAVAIALTAPR